LQASRQMTALLRSPAHVAKEKMATLERAMAVAQHHDAVSGTEKQHVAYDYAKRLSRGTDQVLSYITSALAGQLGWTEDSWARCPLLNISECIPIENKSSAGVFFYNPLAQPRDLWARIPITDTSDCDAASFQVYESYAAKIPSEVVEVDPFTKRIPERASKADYEIVFKASLPPLGLKIYSLTCANLTMIYELLFATNAMKFEHNYHLLQFMYKRPFAKNF